MNRLNKLLMSSLESVNASGGEIEDTLEDYTEYRAALEEYMEATNLGSEISDLINEVSEIESLVTVSRNDGTLDKHQTDFQVSSVNRIREVLGCGVEVVMSSESMDSIYVTSLEASVQSTGLLTKLWEGFLSMLRSIRDTFKRMWNWIFSSEKRATAAMSEINNSVSVIKQSVPEETEISTDLTDEFSLNLSSCFTNRKRREAVEIAIPLINKELDDGIKQMSSDNPIIPEVDTESKSKEITDKLFEDLNETADRGLSKDQVVTELHLMRMVVTDADLKAITDGWDKYPKTVRDVTKLLKKMDEGQALIEKKLAHNIKIMSVGGLNSYAEESLRLKIAYIRSGVESMERNKKILIKYLQSSQTDMNKVASNLGKISKLRKK